MDSPNLDLNPFRRKAVEQPERLRIEEAVTESGFRFSDTVSGVFRFVSEVFGP